MSNEHNISRTKDGYLHAVLMGHVAYTHETQSLRELIAWLMDKDAPK